MILNTFLLSTNNSSCTNFGTLVCDRDTSYTTLEILIELLNAFSQKEDACNNLLYYFFRVGSMNIKMKQEH